MRDTRTMTREDGLPAATPLDAHAYVEKVTSAPPWWRIVINVALVFGVGGLFWSAVLYAELPLWAAVIGYAVVAAVVELVIWSVSRRHARRTRP